MESNKIFEVGYGRVDVTPDYPVHMAGSAANRISTEVLDPLYITCIAFRQEGETFLVFTMDFVGAYGEFVRPLRKTISKATGLEESHIILNATHTHSSVSVRNDKLTGIARYVKDCDVWAVAAAKAALEDLAAAQVRFGSAPTKGMAWVRHYKVADGTYAGANYGSFKPGIVGHASDAYEELQVIRFVREASGKKDVVLVNFPAHATFNQSGTALSADFPGPFRAYIARHTDTLVAYFIAAAGDQVPNSRVPEERFSTDYRVYGEELGRIAVACMETLTQPETPALGFDFRIFEGRSNKEDMHLLPAAKEVEAIWMQVGGRGTPEGKKAAKEHGFSSVYEVTAILNREKFEETRSLELKALSFGRVSMIFAPYEMFGQSGHRIKTGSPYDMTFVASCSYDHAGYLPSELGCRLRCYEAQITKFAYGTADELVGEYVDMLKKLSLPAASEVTAQ